MENINGYGNPSFVVQVLDKKNKKPRSNTMFQTEGAITTAKKNKKKEFDFATR